ncbi:sensor histidine kinase [Priestia koreensis]|uniref:sensor histidine kinase n=1 Tax=Priestia koreensis TaxID=284581 RepID=UPI00203E7898|nr:HAMP domain-containing sensor histidine kinase [Priestia koreensis]MCM3006246.1 HAMP domain-containing histidine kinase [Priestia koreensis]
MTKSIYLKIVIAFIGTVVFSLIVSFVLSTSFRDKEIDQRLQKDMWQVGKEFVHLYGKEDANELASFLHHTSFFQYSFVIYDENMHVERLGNSKHPFRITEGDVHKLLKTSDDYLVSKPKDGPPMGMVMGIPFTEDGQKYVLFLQPDPIKPNKAIQNVQLVQLLSILVVGILSFALLSRQLVKPIRKLTKAMKEIGKGNYNIRVEHESADEIGQLTEHFNHMSKELNKIETMRREFVASVSHEIQSPLTSIRGFANALKEEHISSEDRLRYLSIIEKESSRLAQLGGNLLKLASLDSEHHPVTLSTYSLDEQLRTVILALEPQWSGKDLELDLNMNAVRITADRDLLEQVWMNLLTNSMTYTSEGGKIGVALNVENGFAYCIISDSGIGISKEDQRYIFESFYKADKSRGGKGNGLGLAITKKVVSIHNGSIGLESEIGKGSIFTVTLPLSGDKESRM